MFDRHPVTTPFPVGPVNVYLASRTIVDPGPATDEAWENVRSALEGRGLEPADLERVLITHPHPDHCGLASRLREEGVEVEVYASAETAEILADFGGRLEYERSYFARSFRRHGMPGPAIEAVVAASERIEGVVEDCPVDRILGEGDEVAVGEATVTVETLTGHAPGELLFACKDDGVAIVGDHVLEDVTPNPLLEPPREPDGERPRVLPAFNESLEDLRDRGFDRLLPGHGEPIDRPADRIDEVLAAHEERTAAVLEALEALEGPITAYEVLGELFGELPPGELYPGMSEAIGHLDVLERRGLARRRERSDRITYEPV